MGEDHVAAPQQDKSDSGNERPRRSAILVAYLHEFMEGAVKTPRRPEIHHLSESGLLRIEATVLEIEAKARGTIATNLATMLPTEEHIETYEQALDSDADTVAKWLTTFMFREYLGLPIFTLVADECLVTVARADLPLCLESAAQFALAHMPPDEDFVPQLRLKEFKLYLARALRRDAERVGSKTSGGGPIKPDVDHKEAPAGNASHVPQAATTSSDTAWTQSDLAAKRQAIIMPILNEKRWKPGTWATKAGVGKNCIYEYLDGRRDPGYDSRKAMADALGLPLEGLPD